MVARRGSRCATSPHLATGFRIFYSACRACRYAPDHTSPDDRRIWNMELSTRVAPRPPTRSHGQTPLVRSNLLRVSAYAKHKRIFDNSVDSAVGVWYSNLAFDIKPTSGEHWHSGQRPVVLTESPGYQAELATARWLRPRVAHPPVLRLIATSKKEVIHTHQAWLSKADGSWRAGGRRRSRGRPRRQVCVGRLPASVPVLLRNVGPIAPRGKHVA